MGKLSDNGQIVISEYQNGASMHSIGKKYGVSTSAVQKYLLRKKIPIRSYNDVFSNKDKYLADILIRYYDGESTYKIAKDMNIPLTNINRWMKEFGIDISGGFKQWSGDGLLKDHTDEILAQYGNGLGCFKLSKLWNCSEHSIQQLLHDNNVNIRGPQPLYTVDDTFFEKIDIQVKAYWLGMMMSDGTVDKKFSMFRVALQEGDVHILEDMKKAIKYTGPLYFREKPNERCQNQRVLSIGNVKLARQLNNLGCIPNKSLVLKFPAFDKVPENLMQHMVRGYYDGDGGVLEPRGTIAKYVGITGSVFFIKGLDAYIKSILPVTTHIYDCDNPLTKIWRISNMADSYKFLEWLYHGSTIHLDRKYQQYLEFKCDYEAQLSAPSVS